MIRNPLYQLAELRRYAQAVGWRAALRLRLSDVQSRTGLSKPRLVKIALKNSIFPLLMRTHTSDRDVLWQVFIQREYELVELSNPKTIIDLGANVGYSAAYFLTKYPSATILAVEPDPDSYAICCSNLAPYGPRAKVIHGAAWPERDTLVLDKGSFGDGRDWATRVRPATEPQDSKAADNVPAYDLPTLIGLCPTSEIDLLKIDIERSELELFSRGTEAWLPHVKNLCIELHDPDCAETFFRSLAAYSYALKHTEAVTVCHNLELLGKPQAQTSLT